MYIHDETNEALYKIQFFRREGAEPKTDKGDNLLQRRIELEGGHVHE